MSNLLSIHTLISVVTNLPCKNILKIVAGLGATLKNLGMGLASRKGKLKQHSSVKPFIKEKKCTFCKRCMEFCPQDCIIEKDKKAFIITENCIGCGECLAVCSFDAVAYDWKQEPTMVQKMMAEHALGVIKGKKAIYFNVLINMTAECDCMSYEQSKIISDIGIMASYDPVALNQATLDITKNYNNENLAKISQPHLDADIQLEHAEKIGLGTREYRLITI